MSGKTLRNIAGMGLVAVVLLTCVMLFSLDQVTDTATPRIAAHVHDRLARSLDSDTASTRLVMVREGTGVRAPRRYVLTLRPSRAVGADERAVASLLRHAAEMCAAELEAVKGELTVECVAEVDGRPPVVRAYQRVATDYGPQLRPLTAEPAASARGTAGASDR